MPTLPNPPKTSVQKYSLAIDLLQHGTTLTEAGEALGVGPKVARRWLNKASRVLGVQMERTGVNINGEPIFGLHQEPETCLIASTLDLTDALVARELLNRAPETLRGEASRGRNLWTRIEEGLRPEVREQLRAIHGRVSLDHAACMRMPRTYSEAAVFSGVLTAVAESCTVHVSMYACERAEDARYGERRLARTLPPEREMIVSAVHIAGRERYILACERGREMETIPLSRIFKIELTDRRCELAPVSQVDKWRRNLPPNTRKR
jgi:hypothetical protein